jgi:hypothetical protein
MTFSIDDLPAPLGPMMARISRSLISKLTSEMAFTPPKDRLMRSTSSSVSPILLCGRVMGRGRAQLACLRS